MANEIYIMRATGTPSYQIDLAPYEKVEDTYTKSPDVVQVPVNPGDSVDPETQVIDNKRTLHKFTLTGVLHLYDGDTANGVTSLVSSSKDDTTTKIGRLRLLYGYGSAADTQITFHYNSQDWSGYITRMSVFKDAGRDDYDYIIDVTEGNPEITT
jgi:hypothetical protein